MANEMIQLHISQPCHENWKEMTPTEKGRFCGQCQKTVVDFTAMTDEAILSTLQAAKGNTCGRFWAQQLDRPLQTTQLQRSWLRVKWFWATLISGALFANRVAAQKATYGDTVVVTAPKSKAEVVTLGMVRVSHPVSISIIGQVTDEKGIPMAGVSVTIKGSTVGTSTNALGMYELQVKDPGKFVHLAFSYIGYSPIYQQISVSESKASHIYQQNAQFNQASVVLTGDVVIVRKKKVKPAKTVEPTVIKPATKEMMQVYPNPVIAGQPIYVIQLPAGKYTLQLYSNDGRPVATACLIHSKGSANLSWTLPAPLRAGLYTLLLTNENQQPQTAQVLVQ